VKIFARTWICRTFHTKIAFKFVIFFRNLLPYIILWSYIKCLWHRSQLRLYIRHVVAAEYKKLQAFGWLGLVLCLNHISWISVISSQVKRQCTQTTWSSLAYLLMRTENQHGMELLLNEIEQGMKSNRRFSHPNTVEECIEKRRIFLRKDYREPFTCRPLFLRSRNVSRNPYSKINSSL
jgi:hypothetical protein